DDRQRVERRLGPPPGVGNDADGRVVHFHDAMYTGPPRQLAFVIAHQLAAEYRAGFHRGVQHARQLEVDRIDLGAVELVSGVEPLHRLAGDLPFLRVPELDALGVRRGQPGRRAGDPAVGGRAL